MKKLFKSLIVAGALVCSIGTSPKASAQAITFGNQPFFSPLNLSKSKKIDDAFLVVNYRLTWQYEGSKEQHKDLRTLLIGKNHQYSYNEALYQSDKTSTELIKKGAKGVKTFSEPVIPYEIYLDSKAQTYEFIYRIFFDKASTCYEEKVPTLKWNIKKEEKKIMDYTCLKATTNYNGKSITAWFTPDIATNAGPYLFRGLPGLILAVSTEGLEWEAIGIRKATKEDKILKYGRPKMNMEREKMKKFVWDMYADPVGLFEGVGVECYDSSTDKRLHSGDRSFPLPSLLLLEK